jgi:hypothetical protein
MRDGAMKSFFFTNRFSFVDVLIISVMTGLLRWWLL